MLGNSKSLLIIFRNGFTLYYDSEQKLDFNFQKDTISDLELVNFAKLKDQIKNFVGGSQLKTKKLIILLSNEIIFSKTFIKSQLKEEQIQSFLNTVPIDNSNLTSIRVDENENLTVVTTNKNIFSSIVQSFLDLKWETEIVLPEALILNGINQNLIYGAQLTPELTNQIIELCEKHKESNLLKISEVKKPDSKEEKRVKEEKVSNPIPATTPQKNQTFLTVLGVSLIIIGLTTIAFRTKLNTFFGKYFQKPPKEYTQPVQDLPTLPPIESTESSSSSN